MLKKVLKDTFPVLGGYLVLGIGFGMMMSDAGYGTVWSVLMSLLVYAGSMQYAAVGLLAGGASLFTFALTTLAVNARHLFYGISVLEKYRGTGGKKPYLIFGLTDETYSLVIGSEDKSYCFWVTLTDHIYWVGGTLIGALVGRLFAGSTEGIDFALTALFLTVFTEQWMRHGDRFSALCGVCASVLCLVLFGADGFLIPAMVLILAVLLIREAHRGRT